MNDLLDKVVLLTGAGWSPGREIALGFAALGAKVAVSDLTPVNLDPIMDEIQAQGGAAEIYDADISKKIPAQTMITSILENWARIDILVNIIGVRPRGAILDLDEWDWRRGIDVNLTGPFLTTQIIGRTMREIGGGKIIYVADSPEGTEAADYQAAFNVAKSGLVGLTKSAARELGPHLIQVNAVFRDSGLEGLQRAAPLSEIQNLFGNLDTAAEAVIRLCSPDAGHISGQVIAIR